MSIETEIVLLRLKWARDLLIQYANLVEFKQVASDGTTTMSHHDIIWRDISSINSLLEVFDENKT